MKTSVPARRPLARLILTALLALGMLPLSGLVRVETAQAAYIPRYSTITNGAITFTGNTLGLSKGDGTNAPGTNHGIGAFITTNTALRDGTYPPGTTADWRQNGSAATLNIPAGSTVLYAELIWSGSYSYGGEDVSAFLDGAVNFTLPGGAATPVAPDPATAQTLGTRGPNGTCASDVDNQQTNVIPCFYVRSANVTAQIQQAGAGAYTVGGVPGTQADTPNSGQETRNNAGWTLAVVYGNPSLPARNLTLFVGAEVTNATRSSPVTVSGFCTPPSGALNGRLLVSASEGDARLGGDQMTFGPTPNTLTAISGPNNPVNNFFASQLNGDTGALDTSGTFGERNANAASGTNIAGGRQGWDITNVDVSQRLANAQTSATARGTTNQDQYVVNALGMQIGVGAPFFPTNVKSVDKTQAVVGDILTYTIRVDNRTGTADAQNLLFTDRPPTGTTFVPNSFTVDGVAQPGDDPAAGVNLGTVAMGTQKVVTFQARVDQRVPTRVYDNSASWTYNYVSCAGQPPINGSLTTNQVRTQSPPPVLEADKVATLVVDADKNGSPSAGDTLRYDVTIRNTGADAATGVTYSDIPDPNTKLIVGSVTTSQGTVTIGNTAGDTSVGASIGTLPVGGSVTVSYRVTINNPLPAGTKQIVNQGIVRSNETPDIPTNDPRTPPPGDPTITPITPTPLLSASKNVSLAADADQNGAPSAGDTLEYQVTIKNLGNAAATGVAYNDTPDANTTLVAGSVTTTQGTVTSGNAGAPPVTVDIGTLPVGASVTITYRVTINNPLPAGVTQIINQGVVSSRETTNIPTDDPRTPPPGDPTIVYIPLEPRLTADKADIFAVDANRNGVLSPGDTLEYLITITNRGNGTATGVTFADTPDRQTKLEVGSVKSSQGVVTTGNGASDTSIAIDIGTIAPGASVTISFRVRLNDVIQGSLIRNQGVIDGGNIPQLPTNDPKTPASDDPTDTIILPQPTAIALVSFTAARSGGAVVVRWTTSAELDTWGFHLYRSADGSRANAVRVTPELILGRGRGQGGASYNWTDTGAQPGVAYTYWLQEVELSGAINEYGPASAAVAPSAQQVAFIPLLTR